MPDSAGAANASGRDRHTRPAPPAYLTPSSVADVRELAELIAAGDWAPVSYRGADGHYAVEKIVLGIMHGAAVGLGPFAAVHAIAVIDGQPTIWGDGALALVERSGLLEDMSEDYALEGAEGLTAICTMRRRPWPTPISRRFSMAMAEEAGLTQKEGPWQTYPRRMLMMRARSWTLRDGFADVLRGLSIREEVDDYDSVAGSPPQPAFADQSGSHLRHPIRRPRFADYKSARRPVQPQVATIDRCDYAPLAGHDPFTAGRPKVDMRSTGSHAAAEANASIEDPAPLRSDVEPRVGIEEGCAPGATSRTADIQTSIPTHETDKGIEPLASSDRKAVNEPSVSAAFSLIDQEGSFIDVGTLEELREAFDRLFAAPHLSAAQVLGLWESNVGARGELERAFGIPALADADLRRQSAERERKACCPAQPAKARRSIARNSRSTRSHTKRKDLADETAHELKHDPACSNDELFQLYRSLLLRLRRRRAKAATFIDFRQANRALEDRIRQHLPDRSAEIDALYHWAAVHAG